MTKFSMLKWGLIICAGVGLAEVGRSVWDQKKLSRPAKLFLAGLVFTAAFVFYIYQIEPNWIEVSKVVIHDAQLAQSLQGKRIVQISDLHLRTGLGARERQLIEKVNALRPDFIFITGDFIDDLSQIPPMIEIAQGLRAREGIWGIPGNTDHISIDGKTLAERLAPAGIRFLLNEAERIETDRGKYFWLVGVDDPVYGHANLSAAVRRVPQDSPVILLAHSPDIFEQAAQKEINLVLAGHTHGGQIGIPFLVQFSEYANRGPYMRGGYKKGLSQLYVNRGIGTKTLPVRFLCRPEITLLEIKP